MTNNLLPISISEQEDALEKYMLSKMDELERVDSEDVTAASILFLCVGDLEVPKLAKENGWWQYEALEKRIEYCLTLSLDNRSILFLVIASGGVIGVAMQYLYYTQYLAKKHNIRQVNIKTMTQLFFPKVFRAEGLNRLWYECKVDCGNRTENLIDFSSASQSIQFSNKTN